MRDAFSVPFILSWPFLDTLKHRGTIIFVIFPNNTGAHQILPTGCSLSEAHNQLTSVVVNFFKAENFSKNRKQQPKGGTQS